MKIDKEEVKLELPILTPRTNIEDFEDSIEFPYLFIFRRGENFNELIYNLKSENGRELIESLKQKQKDKKLKELFNGLSKEDIREFLGIHQMQLVQPVKEEPIKAIDYAARLKKK